MVATDIHVMRIIFNDNKCANTCLIGSNDANIHVW